MFNGWDSEKKTVETRLYFNMRVISISWSRLFKYDSNYFIAIFDNLDDFNLLTKKNIHASNDSGKSMKIHQVYSQVPELIKYWST